MTLHDETIAKIRQLPESLVQEVSDFVDFLLMKHNKVITSEANQDKAHRLSEPIAEFLELIQQTPREYWPYLLQMMRLFRDTVTVKPELAADNSEEKAITEMSQAERIQKNQAVIELLKSWEEEGDEIEQTETWQFLRKALDEDRLSNRPLFT
jgi:uncharacterized protein Yka (UPF0111/DUF47 family)